MTEINNDILKAHIHYYKNESKRYKKEIGKLKATKEQECNKLYIQLKADEKYHKENENTLRKIIKNKEKRNVELYKENNKLKQIIIEIKEIVEENFYFLDYDYRWILEQILQKISEVENES